MDFLSFALNFGDKYGKSIINSKNVKKLIDGATKTSKDFAKIAGKKIVHKSTEATKNCWQNYFNGKTKK